MAQYRLAFISHAGGVAYTAILVYLVAGRCSDVSGTMETRQYLRALGQIQTDRHANSSGTKCTRFIRSVYRDRLKPRRLAACYLAKADGSLKREAMMAKYGRAAGKTVKSAMRRRKQGTLRSGKGGKGGVVKSRKQAIAIGLSEARKKGAKVPKKSS